MNRVIKFRAWDKDGKSMWTNIGMNLDKILNNERFEVMQFTGVLDKHGKEIYEGDILKHEFERKGVKKHTHTKVVWGEAFLSWAAVTYFQDSSLKPMWTNLTSPKVFGKERHDEEIVGNIFENPELLHPPSNQT